MRPGSICSATANSCVSPERGNWQRFMARSDETQRSFARQLFHHMVQQPILAYGPDSIAELSTFFKDHQYNMKHLAVEIACRSNSRGWTRTSEPVAAAETK